MSACALFSRCLVTQSRLSTACTSYPAQQLTTLFTLPASTSHLSALYPLIHHTCIPSPLPCDGDFGLGEDPSCRGLQLDHAAGHVRHGLRLRAAVTGPGLTVSRCIHVSGEERGLSYVPNCGPSPDYLKAQHYPHCTPLTPYCET